jgi:hypothetical protein
MTETNAAKMQIALPNCIAPWRHVFIQFFHLTSQAPVSHTQIFRSRPAPAERRITRQQVDHLFMCLYCNNDGKKERRKKNKNRN